MEYDRLILNSNNIMRTSWKLINKELGKDCKKCEFQSLNINGRNITNLQDIANAFTDHFTTIPAMISQKVNASICLTKTSDNNQNNFFFSLNHVFQNTFPSIRYHCTTTNEIKSSNSSGYDEIPSRVLKLYSYFISSPLNYICSRTLLTGVFPDRLKYATIRPLFKKGNKDDINNYRPISILTSFSKLFEKILRTRLLKHLTEHNILVKEEYGFRTNLKTDNAAFLTNGILNALNNSLLIGDIFCDLEKAFDSVNHKILLTKLEFCGITGGHYRLFESYLMDRYQRIILYN